MKKLTCLSLLFLGLLSKSFSQEIEATFPGGSMGVMVQWGNSSATPALDSGTNKYVLWVSSISFQTLMYRQNGYWYIWIAQFGQYGGDYGRWKYPIQSTSADPPCTGTWEFYPPGSSTTNGQTRDFTMVPTNGAVCSVPPPPSVQSTILAPTGLTLPQLYNTQIFGITSPQPGQMVWSIDDNCVKVYNGTSWNCL
ncbi:MAG: hypothetical protein NXI00_06750 [Cytophagales bacterium]|nr:hypothetical protein [Cytophagales bacterium]